MSSRDILLMAAGIVVAATLALGFLVVITPDRTEQLKAQSTGDKRK